ncbi:Nitrous oxide reductase accessory protein NosL [Halobiforma haloterrestris]|uniref:Nitrous oxide reductase accessory protein NosL n=1 Tax=Natronobacterium haloterrestre TaxID=148448 RepID=A0A1I1EDV1_NATHA|nr:nitrous oxide reductase accessory protein NosL [Halobiforma haloterrestris]SFB83508.1 Nitrous oxide reductase accessory protein NosL [Halobiforma haloterrestris]
MDEQTRDEGRPRDGVARRAVLIGAAGVGMASLAGCLGGDGDAPDPITIEGEQTCDQCTMVIGQHPGPVGQAHYADAEAVVGEDRPAQFCSSLCTYTYTFERSEAGDDPEATYLTDYSSVEYSIDTADDVEEISNHLEAEAFAAVEDLSLVVDSEVQGAMGPSMIGFTDGDEAEEFQADHGGELYDHEDVTSELVMSLMGGG